ncbi:sensor histidine kinase [Hymenobacter sp. PAMC 26628]|uniref:sensor histidine kinase n=1 Tax=Hymenobacter sp. PAMC 26628 TaxID=1484118 RepID=UPI00090202AE|nr:ATP-binding protein [Hymenobacter sp. PAMC 26628]
MKVKLSTKIFAGILLLLGLFAAVLFVNYRLAVQVVSNARAVAESQRVSEEANGLLRNIVDMETGFRGYLLSGDEQSLDPYYQGERQLVGRFNDLRTLVAHNPAQVGHLNRSQHLFQQWSAYTHLIVMEKRRVHLQHPEMEALAGLPHRRLVEGLTGKQIMDNVRFHLSQFDVVENATRGRLDARRDASIGRAQWISVTAAVAALVLGLAWAAYLAQGLARRLTGLVGLARRLSAGEYDAQLVDDNQDELSVLTGALNGLGRTVNTNIGQLEARNRELDQFAYVVSHDLKAPLRGIESASRWIEEDMGPDKLPAHIREFLGLMRQRVHRMENLITGILDLARVGRVTEVNETVFVRQLLREIAANLNLPAGLHFELPFFLPTLVTTRVQLEQVFTNLISNAVKYHEHPEQANVTIGCDDAGDFYRFSVMDDGPGIAAEYHERIFVIFQTLVERDTLESTGVGLAIVKKIVERQGGTIGIESVPGQGATFAFTWPKQPPSSQTKSAKANTLAPALAA